MHPLDPRLDILKLILYHKFQQGEFDMSKSFNFESGGGLLHKMDQRYFEFQRRIVEREYQKIVIKGNKFIVGYITEHKGVRGE